MTSKFIQNKQNSSPVYKNIYRAKEKSFLAIEETLYAQAIVKKTEMIVEIEKLNEKNRDMVQKFKEFRIEWRAKNVLCNVINIDDELPLTFAQLFLLIDFRKVNYDETYPVSAGALQHYRMKQRKRGELNCLL